MPSYGLQPTQNLMFRDDSVRDFYTFRCDTDIFNFCNKLNHRHELTIINRDGAVEGKKYTTGQLANYWRPGPDYRSHPCELVIVKSRLYNRHPDVKNFKKVVCFTSVYSTVKYSPLNSRKTSEEYITQSQKLLKAVAILYPHNYRTIEGGNCTVNIRPAANICFNKSRIITHCRDSKILETIEQWYYPVRYYIIDGFVFASNSAKNALSEYWMMCEKTKVGYYVPVIDIPAPVENVAKITLDVNGVFTIITDITDKEKFNDLYNEWYDNPDTTAWCARTLMDYIKKKCPGNMCVLKEDYDRITEFNYAPHWKVGGLDK